jgi:hypothetical protein
MCRQGRVCAVRAEKQSGGVGFLNNVEDWRNRAKKIRVIAETILDGASREALLQIANDWEWMAQSAEEQLNEASTPKELSPSLNLARCSEEKIAAEGGVTLVPASSEDETKIY